MNEDIGFVYMFKDKSKRNKFYDIVFLSKEIVGVGNT